MIPAFAKSCCNLVDRWTKLVSPEGSYELDVATEFHILAGDFIPYSEIRLLVEG